MVGVVADEPLLQLPGRRATMATTATRPRGGHAAGVRITASMVRDPPARRKRCPMRSRSEAAVRCARADGSSRRWSWWACPGSDDDDVGQRPERLPSEPTWRHDRVSGMSWRRLLRGRGPAALGPGAAADGDGRLAELPRARAPPVEPEPERLRRLPARRVSAGAVRSSARTPPGWGCSRPRSGWPRPWHRLRDHPPGHRNRTAAGSAAVLSTVSMSAAHVRACGAHRVRGRVPGGDAGPEPPGAVRRRRPTAGGGAGRWRWGS